MARLRTAALLVATCHAFVPHRAPARVIAPPRVRARARPHGARARARVPPASTTMAAAASASAPRGAAAREAPSWMPTATERKKLLPLGLMFFCILFNYTILRNTKDVLVVTARGSGAEIIPFLKTYVQLPSALLFTALYSRMCNTMSQESIFYTLVSGFLGFFATFAVGMYPFQHALHPHAFCDWLLAAGVPKSLSGFVGIFRNWSFSLFYCMAEMWGSVVHERHVLGAREPHHVGHRGEEVLPALRPRRERRAHLRGLVRQVRHEAPGRGQAPSASRASTRTARRCSGSRRPCSARAPR